MELVDRKVSVDFDALWEPLHETTRCLITGQAHFSRDWWNDRIADVYNICIAQPKVQASGLYQAVRSLLEYYVSALNKHLNEASDSDLLATYSKYWEKYDAAVPYLNQLYSGLNKHAARKSKSSSLDIDYFQYYIECNDQLLEVGEVAMDVWLREIVQKQKERIVRAILYEIHKDRSGVVVNHGAIQAVILSFVDLLQFKPKNQLQLYEDLFEIPFFKASTDYFIQTSQHLRDSCDCSTFLKKVIFHISDEAVRSCRYLHPSSQKRLVSDCRAWLLCEENLEFLNENCRSVVEREQWQVRVYAEEEHSEIPIRDAVTVSGQDLSNMYQLLSGVEDSFKVLNEEFKNHVIDVAFAIMQSLQGDNMAAQFVEAIAEFRTFYRDRVRVVFESNTKFYAAVDKACLVAVNYKRHPKAHCLAPELLSQYCDELMQKGSKNLSETEADEKLNQVVVLFSYLIDRDLFQLFYSRSMAKRLIHGQQQSMDMEEAMISKLKQVSGYEYTSKLLRMFTDITISSDLNVKFADFITEQADRQLALSLNVSVLQVGAWPLPHTNLPSFLLPPEFEKSVAMFEQFYGQYYSGRKLTWMYQLCHVDVRFGFCKRQYIVAMEMYMAAILLCFEKNDCISFRELLDSTQLPPKELVRKLQYLVTSKILLAKGTLSEESEFQLNSHYSNKRTKFRILPVTRFEQVQESVQTHVAAEEDRRMFVQAAIVRVMKARKELRHSILIQEVINQAKGRFTPRISSIKRCIEILIEKQYLERSKDNKELYVYVA